MNVIPEHDTLMFALVKPGEHGINLCLLFDTEPAARRAADEYLRIHRVQPGIVEVEVSVEIGRVVQMGDIWRHKISGG